MTYAMNVSSRIIWLLLNIFFGGFLSFILMIWVGCDMEIPIFFFPILPTSIGQSIFNVPWIDLKLSLFSKICFNGFLFSIFGFVHTFFAQETVQNYLVTKFSLPKSALRTFYLILTNMASWLIVGLWQHTSIQLWDFLMTNLFQKHAILLILFGLITMPGVDIFVRFGLLECFGIQQLFQYTTCPMTVRSSGMNTLLTNGLFEYCRHPMYFILLLGYILSPSVSFDRFLFIIYTCIYLSVAIPIEEKKLEKIFGQKYIDYKRHVPCLIPNFDQKKKI